MAQKKPAPKGSHTISDYRYSAEQGEDGLWHARVDAQLALPSTDRGIMFYGTSGYKDAASAETEAHAWCRDRGLTAHPA